MQIIRCYVRSYPELSVRSRGKLIFNGHPPGLPLNVRAK